MYEMFFKVAIISATNVTPTLASQNSSCVCGERTSGFALPGKFSEQVSVSLLGVTGR